MAHAPTPARRQPVDRAGGGGTPDRGPRPMRVAPLLLLLVASAPLHAAEGHEPVPGDFTVRDFRFASGGVLPELRIHYRTVGQPRRDDRGVVRNAVLVLHGTTGSGAG